VKQYFKEQHALRTETTINNPNDFYVNKGIANLSHLRDLGHQVKWEAARAWLFRRMTRRPRA
jgi:hypothetical protein